MPHPSKARLEAMVAKGEAFRGKLDVFEHNPGEGYVMVGRGGGSGDLLDGLSDPGGRTQVTRTKDSSVVVASSCVYYVLCCALPVFCSILLSI